MLEKLGWGLPFPGRLLAKGGRPGDVGEALFTRRRGPRCSPRKPLRSQHRAPIRIPGHRFGELRGALAASKVQPLTPADGHGIQSGHCWRTSDDQAVRRCTLGDRVLGYDTKAVVRQELQTRWMPFPVRGEDDVPNLVLRDGILAAVQKVELGSLDVRVQNVDTFDAVMVNVFVNGDLRKSISAIVPIGENRVRTRLPANKTVAEDALHVVQREVALAEL